MNDLVNEKEKRKQKHAGEVKPESQRMPAVSAAPIWKLLMYSCSIYHGPPFPPGLAECPSPSSSSTRIQPGASVTCMVRKRRLRMRE